MNEPILATRGVGRVFKVGSGANKGELHALSNINLVCHSGRSLGVLGESGCGKTTLNRLLLNLDSPTSGEIHFLGKPLSQMSRAEKLEYRRTVQPVFQNPFSSLSPRVRVKDIIKEPLRAASKMSSGEISKRVDDALVAVGLQPQDGNRFPSQFSGGQRQRIAIARAIASKPKLMLLDEPVSSQDISIRSQILNLLKDLQQEIGMGSLFISHDIATVRFMCDEVIVIYLGRIIEQGSAAKICQTPDHPYTKALLAATLPADPDRQTSDLKPVGEIPSPLNPPSGCAYNPRCPFAKEICRTTRPELAGTAGGGMVACHMTHAETW